MPTSFDIKKDKCPVIPFLSLSSQGLSRKGAEGAPGRDSTLPSQDQRDATGGRPLPPGRADEADGADKTDKGKEGEGQVQMVVLPGPSW